MNGVQCSCGECAWVTNVGTELFFVCCDIDRVEVMKGDRKCITLTDYISELILNFFKRTAPFLVLGK